MIIDRNSWHYTLAKIGAGRPVYFYEPKDLCTYTKLVATGILVTAAKILLCCFLFVVVIFPVLHLLWTIASSYEHVLHLNWNAIQCGPIDEVGLMVVCSMIAATIIVGAMVGTDRINNHFSERMQSPSFISMVLKSIREKTCFKIEYTTKRKQ